MTEKAVILVSRKNASTSELLFIRLRKALFYQFPVVVRTGKGTIKSAIRKNLEDNLQVETREVRKAGVTGYQPLAGVYVRLVLYTVDVEGNPQATGRIGELAWLSKAEALKRTAQMTNNMQDYVFPYLETKGLW